MAESTTKEDQETKEKAQKELFKAFERIYFKLELGDERNRSITPSFITPLTLRGRWDWGNCRGMMVVDDERYGKLRELPDIMGICIEFEGQRRKAIMYDPLLKEENQERMEVIQAILLKVEGKKCGPMEDQPFDNLDEHDLMTWCWWGRRLLDEESCRVLKGSVPTEQECRKLNAMGCKIRLREINRVTQEPIMIDIPKQYRPSKIKRPMERSLKEEVF